VAFAPRSAEIKPALFLEICARAVFLSAGKAGKISTEPALSWVGEAISLPVARLAGVGFAHCLAVGKHNPGAYSFIDRRDSNPT